MHRKICVEKLSQAEDKSKGEEKLTLKSFSTKPANHCRQNVAGRRQPVSFQIKAQKAFRTQNDAYKIQRYLGKFVENHRA